MPLPTSKEGDVPERVVRFEARNWLKAVAALVSDLESQRSTESWEPDFPDDEDDDYDPCGGERFAAQVAQAHAIVAQKRFAEAEDAWKLDPDNHDLIASKDDAAEELKTAIAEADKQIAVYLRLQDLVANRIRLANFVRDRRAELNDMSQEELAARTGVSVSTIKIMERRKDNNPRRGFNLRSQRALEVGLGWAKNSIANILAGGDPVIADSDPSEFGIPWGEVDDGTTWSDAETEAKWSDGDAGTTRKAVEALRERLRIEGSRPVDQSSLVALRVERGVVDQLRALALGEQRNLNDVLEDAVDLYVRVHGPRSHD